MKRDILQLLTHRLVCVIWCNNENAQSCTSSSLVQSGWIYVGKYDYGFTISYWQHMSTWTTNMIILVIHLGHWFPTHLLPVHLGHWFHTYLLPVQLGHGFLTHLLVVHLCHWFPTHLQSTTGELESQLMWDNPNNFWYRVHMCHI